MHYSMQLDPWCGLEEEKVRLDLALIIGISRVLRCGSWVVRAPTWLGVEGSERAAWVERSIREVQWKENSARHAKLVGRR
jgi:hypothetical protein